MFIAIPLLFAGIFATEIDTKTEQAIRIIKGKIQFLNTCR
jgi:hypothetical protein